MKKKNHLKETVLRNGGHTILKPNAKTYIIIFYMYLLGMLMDYIF